MLTPGYQQQSVESSAGVPRVTELGLATEVVTISLAQPKSNPKHGAVISRALVGADVARLEQQRVLGLCVW